MSAVADAGGKVWRSAVPAPSRDGQVLDLDACHVSASRRRSASPARGSAGAPPPSSSLRADRRRSRARDMSSRISVRFAPAIAPTIAVTRASRSVAAWKPSQAPASAPAAAATSPTRLALRRPVAVHPGQVDRRARSARRRTASASSSSSSGTPGIVVITIRTPRNQPPRPSTIGYSERSVALALRPKLPAPVHPAGHPAAARAP